MKNITDGFRALFGSSLTKGTEFGQYVSGEVVDRKLEKLEKSDYCNLGQVCYVIGMGGHPQSSYDEMKNWLGVRVVHSESVLPRGLRFIPSYRGIVRIEIPSMLRPVFRRLMEQGSVAAYVFDAGLETRFLDLARSVDEHRDRSFGIKDDSGYLIYFVDEDRDDSPTGIAEFMSHGASGPWGVLFRE